MNEQSPRPRNTINAVKRALDVLLLFTTSGSAYLGVSQIAGQLRISKAVVYRMLSTLRTAGLVELDEATRRYSLGPTALALADAVPGAHRHPRPRAGSDAPTVRSHRRDGHAI